ncbi:MAG: hypothetical protein H7A40_01185 [Chlamydiales bacterium]|nr:hypothetical protein [Chlamydiales bacterium]
MIQCKKKIAFIALCTCLFGCAKVEKEVKEDCNKIECVCKEVCGCSKGCACKKNETPTCPAPKKTCSEPKQTCPAPKD